MKIKIVLDKETGTGEVQENQIQIATLRRSLGGVWIVVHTLSQDDVDGFIQMLQSFIHIHDKGAIVRSAMN